MYVCILARAVREEEEEESARVSFGHALSECSKPTGEGEELKSAQRSPIPAGNFSPEDGKGREGEGRLRWSAAGTTPEHVCVRGFDGGRPPRACVPSERSLFRFVAI